MSVTCEVEQGGLEQAKGHNQTLLQFVYACALSFCLEGLAVLADTEQCAVKEAEECTRESGDVVVLD